MTPIETRAEKVVHFSREAGRLLGSPYFFRPPPDVLADTVRYLQWSKDRLRERDAIREALARNPDMAQMEELPPKLWPIWDAAAEELINTQAADDYLEENLHGDVTGTP